MFPETVSVQEALADLNATIDKSNLEMSALEALDANGGPSTAMEDLFVSLGHPSINNLYQQVVSEEGLVDYVKEKLSKLANKFQIFANSVYGKFRSHDEEFQRALERAKATGNGDGLPIGKAASIITTLGALAAASAAAAFGVKSLSDQSSSKKIREEARKKSTELKNRIHDKFAKTGVIPEREVKALHQRLMGDLKRNVNSFGQHLKAHKGEYATAAAATAAVSGVVAGGMKFHKDAQTMIGDMQAGGEENPDKRAAYRATAKGYGRQVKKGHEQVRGYANAAADRAKDYTKTKVGKAKGLFSRNKKEE